MITGKRSQFEQRCGERGYSLAEVAGCIVSEDGDFITVDERHPSYPWPRVCLPGTALKRILAEWIGIRADDSCGCDGMARKMDSMGVKWCEGEGMQEIVSSMKSAHAKLWSAGKTRLPWSDLAAKKLVRLACALASRWARANP